MARQIGFVLGVSVLVAILLGPIHLTRALAPALRSAKGTLVNIGSVLGWFAVGKAHSVSKAGLWMATNAFRLELAPLGVQVLGVHAGPTDTPMQAGDDPAGMNQPSDVAAAILDAVETGENELIVDGLTTKVHNALSAPVAALWLAGWIAELPAATLSRVSPARPSIDRQQQVSALGYV
ncbi:SDR family NAD(P)-dependent oxidoreductase [Streptomyces sp. NPDC010273]|uniref:SDR family NAD(P)-dependent oxidoreductase n=1 Tax=Streptomyces sp. NPDC010273 TaxID=3364829 RepID=UPI0036E6795F